MPTPHWRLEFHELDTTSFQGQWRIMSWYLADVAAKYRRVCEARAWRCKANVVDFRANDTRSPNPRYRQQLRWRIMYSNELARARPSRQLSNELAAPLFLYMADLIYEFGDNLRPCQITVRQEVDARKPIIPYRPRSNVQARGGFLLQQSSNLG